MTSSSASTAARLPANFRRVRKALVSPRHYAAKQDAYSTKITLIVANINTLKSSSELPLTLAKTTEEWIGKLDEKHLDVLLKVYNGEIPTGVDQNEKRKSLQDFVETQAWNVLLTELQTTANVLQSNPGDKATAKKLAGLEQNIEQLRSEQSFPENLAWKYDDVQRSFLTASIGYSLHDLNLGLEQTPCSYKNDKTLLKSVAIIQNAISLMHGENDPTQQHVDLYDRVNQAETFILQRMMWRDVIEASKIVIKRRDTMVANNLAEHLDIHEYSEIAHAQTLMERALEVDSPMPDACLKQIATLITHIDQGLIQPRESVVALFRQRVKTRSEDFVPTLPGVLQSIIDAGDQETPALGNFDVPGYNAELRVNFSIYAEDINKPSATIVHAAAPQGNSTEGKVILFPSLAEMAAPQPVNSPAINSEPKRNAPPVTSVIPAAAAE